MISIIVPVYNEEVNIPILYSQLKKQLDNLEMSYEIIFVNDGSNDQSRDRIASLIKSDSKVKVIDFSRNFGKEVAITAGLNHALGEAAIMIDADLQHPPELIPEFISKWKSGKEIVIGVRQDTKKQNIFRKFFSWFFYKFINLVSDTEIVPKATDYRLLDKKVIREFNRLTERNRMARGLIDWLGFDREYICFTANERIGSSSRFSAVKLMRLAISSVVSLSLFPLKLAGYLGIFITFFSGLLGLFVLVEKYFLSDPLNMNFSGSAILAIIIMFLVGIILICLGLIALYIASIHGEVLNRPLYVIREKKNF